MNSTRMRVLPSVAVREPLAVFPLNGAGDDDEATTGHRPAFLTRHTTSLLDAARPRVYALWSPLRSRTERSRGPLRSTFTRITPQ